MLKHEGTWLMPKVSVTGAVGDYTDPVWGAPGPQGATGPVGSMNYNYTTGNVSVNTGPGGWVSVTGTTGPSTWSNNTTSYTYDPYGSHSADITLKRNGKPDIQVGKTLDAIMDRLCIIEPALEKLEKYPALRAAYENYKLIEAMIQNDEGTDNE